MNQVQNSVTLIGNLGADPVTRKGNKDVSIIKISLATNETITRNGEKTERTDWHRCTIFGKKGEVIGKYAKKGTRLAVQGKLRYSIYTDKDGIERTSTEIVVNDFMFVDNNKDEAKAA